MRKVLMLSIGLLVAVDSASQAQIVNGDFESAGAGWAPVGVSSWVYDFPSSGCR